MHNSRYTINKSFDYPINNTYQELHIRPDVLECIHKANIKTPPLLHKHCLTAMLSRNDMFISSPPATGKTSLVNIAVHQILQRNSINLQFIFLEGKDYLVKQTFEDLIDFAYDWNLKYCVSDRTTALKDDYGPFKHCQIAIASTYKLLGLLQNARRTYETLKVVIIDAVHSDDIKFPQILDLLYAKAPHIRYWWMNDRKEISESMNFILVNYIPYALKAMVLEDYDDVNWISHYYIQVQNLQERLEMMQKIINHSPSIQVVLFYVNNEELEDYKWKLGLHNPGIVRFDEKVSVSDAIINQFNNGMFKLLICAGKQVFARRIKTIKPVYVVISKPVGVNAYEVLSRRAGMKNNDRIFTVVSNNDEIESIETVAGFYGFKMQKWPNANDS